MEILSGFALIAAEPCAMKKAALNARPAVSPSANSILNNHPFAFLVNMDNYDVIVIGAGHAGIEAALACSRMGCKTLLVTLRTDTIGVLSCNPAIGGVGKGQLVKEIDALGGAMAKAADACGIQFRILNASKGAAVQSSRAQIDMDMYKHYMQELIKPSG